VAALKLKLLPQERSDILRKPTENTEAYRYFLMARSVYHRGGPIRRSLRVAKQMFQKAAALDPRFARAHASIADCNCFLLDAGDTSITFEEIMAAAELALKLDPTLADAHASKGHAFYTKGLYNDATACFQTALDLDPNLFEAHFFAGRNAFNQGQLPLAAQHFDRAAELKQDDYRSLGLLAMCLQSMGQVEDSATANRKALARIESFIAARPDEAHALGFGAGILAMLGERERAMDWADRALIIEPDDHDLAYNLACAFALIGQVDRAVDLLEGAMEGLPLKSRIEYMHQDSDLAALRGHPRFEALLKNG
jgi:adenylate cyclase